MPEEPDFDTEIDTAWRRFDVRLRAYLAAMAAGDLLTICSGGGKKRDDLYLTVTSLGGVELRSHATVQGALVRATSEEDRSALAEAGWLTEPENLDDTKIEFRVTGGPDAVTYALAALLRDFRGIAHPSFLAASSVGASVTTVFDTGTMIEESDAAGAREQLVAAVDSALRSILGTVPARDEDGDVRFVFDGQAAYLRILDAEPVVELFAVFPVAIGTDTAGSAVSLLASSWPDIKFQFGVDHVVASTRIDCAPVVEEHVGRRLGMFVRFVEEQGEELAALLSEGHDGSPLPPELMTLIHLQADPSESLSPENVALICHNDRDSILDFMKICSVEHELWISRADHALEHRESDEAQRYEAESWRRTEELLRGALRFVVLVLTRRQPGTES